MKKRFMLIAALLAASLATGCGSGSSSYSNGINYSSSYKNSYSSSYSKESGSAGYAEEYASYEEDAYNIEAEDTVSDDTVSDDNAFWQPQEGQKIVYTGEIAIQTLEYDTAKRSINEKIRTAGGFIENEEEYDNDNSWYTYENSSNQNRSLYVTARIPSENFESFISSLEGSGKIVSKSMSAQNISQVYADTKTYIEALEKEETRLLEMMDKAESIEDMIAVETRLSEVERQLNSHKTKMSSMDKQVQYSTINISLKEVKRYSETSPEISFREKVSYAFSDAVSGFKMFCENIVLFLIRYFPYLFIAAVIILFTLFKKNNVSVKIREAASNQQIAITSDSIEGDTDKTAEE